MRYFLILLICCASKIFASGGQLLNSTFFPNPAAISSINNFEFIGGNLFFVPTLSFTGTSYGKVGSAQSSVYDPIPYLYVHYRLTDKWVIGINMLPSVYGDLLWPADSIVSTASVITNVLYYRSGILASYQITPDLSFGMGINLERNYLEVAFMDPLLGFERNKSAGYHYVSDFGLKYRINSKDSVSIAYYTPVHYYSRGVSRASNIANYNYATLNANAAVSFVNFNHIVNELWNLKSTIYFSKWNIKKRSVFYNTVSGSEVLPTYWRNVWSFLFASQHILSDKISFAWDVLYETNPVSKFSYNYVGFPLASALNFSANFEFNVYKNIFVKVIGSYGTFAPNARINNANNYGVMSANIYTGALEGTYKF